MKTHSAKRLTLILICSIFATEALIMLAFEYLPPLPAWLETLIDATALSLLSAPSIYFFAFRPLSKNISELEMTEKELRSHREQLEILVQIRTAELNSALRAAEEASRAKSEFLASMSHELRTPLNAILGFAQLVLLDSKISQETKNRAHEIAQAGKQLLSLVNNLIDLARIEAGKMGLSVEASGLKLAVSDSLEMVAALAGDKDISIINQSDISDILTVRADHGRLRQVLINLLTNAIKYNRTQGSVTLSVRTINDKVRISIADTGAGIPADKQKNIFNAAFNRLGREGGAIEGAGIGLVITKRIVEAMDGNIGFESIEGHGSTFWVELQTDSPIEFIPPETEVAIEKTEPETVSASTSPLLVAEDNRINQRLFVAILNRLGYTVDVVNNGAEAVLAARTGQYPLIFMDCQMPEMDGFEATAAIRNDEKGTDQHISIIAVTADAMISDREKCLSSGMDDYMTKPIDLVRLQEVLNTWLQKPVLNSHKESADGGEADSSRSA